MRRFFIPVIMGIVLLFNTIVASAESYDKSSAFDNSNLNKGVVTISYTSKGSKLKVMVEKDVKKYTYNLKNDGTKETFSLQMGNGEYKVSILENIKGNQYRYMSTEKVTLNLDEQNEVYLTSVQNIAWDDNNLAVRKAKELTKDLITDMDKLNAIYNYVVNNYSYDYEKLNNLKSDYLPDIDLIAKTRKGICYDYASLFAAMLRSVGIPTKLVKGYTKNVNGYHAWNEVYDSTTKNWIIIDTTYDSQMKTANNNYSIEKSSELYTKEKEY